MADTDVDMAFNVMPSLLEQLSKALIELEAHKDGAADTVSIMDIIEHFRDLEAKMIKKYTELEAKEKAFKQEEYDSRALLAAQEAAVAAKEQDMLDRIQVLKDAAVAAIAETRANHLPPSVFTVYVVEPTENKVSSSLDETIVEFSEEKGGDITFHKELTKFCEEMDTKGLLAFVTENQKNSTILFEELSHALKTSTEPGRLILDSLEGFYPLDDIKDTAALQGMRQSCITLMEAMNAMLAKADVGLDHLLTYEIKQQAKAIADEWRPKLGHDGIINAANGKLLEAEAFLQLLSTFKIASEFAEDELCKMLIAVCERRQAPELCRSLGLAHKMPGVIEELISEGKLISAVHFVHAFDLVDKFPSVPLLKTYLKDLRRNSQLKCIKSPNSESVQIEGNANELAALRAVIYCVQRYNLESDYPLDPLHRRVGQLERAKTDRKRSRDSTTQHESTTKHESTSKRKSTSKHESPRKHESTSKHKSTSKRESTSKRLSNKKRRANEGGVYGNHSPATSYLVVNGRQAPAPVYMDRGPYPAPPSDRYPHVDPYNYQPAPPHNQMTYSQHVYKQNAYSYPPDDRAAATAAPPPSAYENTYYYPPDNRAAAAQPPPSVYDNTYYYPPDNRAAAAAAPPPSAYENAYYYPPDNRAAAAAAAAAQPPSAYENAYYYPPDDRTAATNAPPPTYVGYHGSGVPSSYQPYT